MSRSMAIGNLILKVLVASLRSDQPLILANLFDDDTWRGLIGSSRRQC